MRLALVVCLLAACSAPDADESCWSRECPSDPGATTCGTCKHWAHDTECPPGFVCNCHLVCAAGPRTPDGGGSCLTDASPIEPDADLSPDAQHYDWSVCDPQGGADLR